MTRYTMTPEVVAQGACVGVDPDLFFPIRGDSTEEAKAICRGCIIREECLTEALEKNQDGIWGASSHRQRRIIRRAGLTALEAIAWLDRDEV